MKLYFIIYNFIIYTYSINTPNKLIKPVLRECYYFTGLKCIILFYQSIFFNEYKMIASTIMKSLVLFIYLRMKKVFFSFSWNI